MLAMIITLYDMGLPLKPSTCPDCPHRQATGATAARKQERLNREYVRRVGLADEDEDDCRIE